MKKSKKSQQNKNQRSLMIGVVVVLAFGIFAAVMVLGGQGDSADSATSELISPAAYTSDFTSPAVEHMLIDVRTPQEFAEGHIAGAVNIPVDVIDQYTGELPEDMPIVIYCRSGNRSGQAVRILENAGVDNLYDIDGGTIAWAGAGLSLVQN